MAVITTGNHPAQYWPGVKAFVGNSYREHPTTWSKLFTKTDSDKKYEEYVGLTNFGLPQVKSEGAAIYMDSQQQGYTTRLTNVGYGLGFVVTHEEIADKQYPALANRYSRDLVKSFVEGKETNGANIYNRAFNATYVGGDGVSLCNSAHPYIYGGTWSNVPAVPADLSEASLEDALTAINTFQGERGRHIAVRGHTLVVDTSNEFNGYRLLNSIKQPDSASNNPNAVKDMGALPGGMVVNVWFDNPGAWFIKTNLEGEGLLYQEREAFTFDRDNDFLTKNALAAGYERYAFGWNSAYAIYGVDAP